MSRRRNTKLAGSAALALALLTPAMPAAAQPTLAAPTTVAGPSSAINELSGMSIARDGTGGLVFTQQNGGVQNVYVSRLVNGSFQPPEQLDGGLATDSSQPVIAAGNGGLLLVAFVNGGSVYVNQVGSPSTAFGGATLLVAGAANPAISLSNYGKGYLAFTADAPGNGGHDVRAAYYNAGTWALESTPLDANPADDAGTGTGRPAVVAAGDGVGVVAWGENGHIYTRRLWGTTPSVAVYQADPPTVSGLPEVSADQPSIGAGGDSSYAVVGFRASVQSGAQVQTRVLMSRLVAGQYDPVVGADGLGTPGSDGAQNPHAVVGEYGRGFLLSERTNSHELFALSLGTNGGAQGVVRVDSQANSAAPLAVGGTAGLFSSVLAWQQQAVAGLPEIHLSFVTDGGPLGTEQVASNPLLGPTDAADGLAAGGDVNGDGVVAWIQGAGPSTRIEAAQLFQPPGGFSLVRAAYARTSQPTFSWSAAKESWGPVSYAVSLNGAVVGTTTTTSFQPPTPLADGPYTWQVTATNQGGLTSSAGPATIVVDTLAPSVQAAIGGRPVVGSPVHVQVAYNDLRPGEAATGSSGIATVTVSFGDGSSYNIAYGKFHVYSRPGLYRVTVTVTDRAGNVSTIVRYLRILPRPARGRVRRLG
jgi:PKD repeat protein